MSQTLYTGRSVQKQILKSFLSASFGATIIKGAGSFTPRIFLFTGENGMGKSTLVDICLECVEEITGSGKSVTSLLLDVDAWRFRNGLVPNTVTIMLETLAATAIGTQDSFASALAPYDALKLRIAEAQKRKKELLATHWPLKMFLTEDYKDGVAPANKAAGPDERDAREWLVEKMGEEDVALTEAAKQKLTESLTACLREASLETPFILIIDSLELLTGSEIDSWLKNDFLPPLVSEKSNIAVVLSGSSGFSRSIRNIFSDELLYSFPLSAIPLSKNDIRLLAEKANVPLKESQAGPFEAATAGIPLVVAITLDAAARNIPLNKVLQKKSADIDDASRLVRECVDYFIKTLENETDRTRILTLSMIYRFDENILSQLWGISSEEFPVALADLAEKYSFIQGRQLHQAVYEHLRNCLQSEIQKGADSFYATLIQSFAAISMELHYQYMVHMQNEMPDAAARYADPSFQVTLLGLLNAHLWASQEQAARLLPGLFIEALHYQPDFAASLLGFADENKTLLQEKLSGLIDTLKNGLPVAQQLTIPAGCGKRSAIKALDFMKSHEGDMNQTQRGLLHRMRGVLACQAGNYDRAMEEFSQSNSLFTASTPEQALLFENFLCVGCACVAAGELKKADRALAMAVTIAPNDYCARFRLARTQQQLGEHNAAIVSYNEAVRIRPDAAEAWIEIGNEYATTADHEKAVEAFTKATLLVPDQPLLWYNLGISLEALSRFAEAENALSKAVEFLPDHWEAHFALGRAESAQQLAQQAIASFSNVVEFNPDCTDAWKALGSELYGVESYQRAAVSLEKALELDPEDAAIWDLLGKSWYGASNYEKAVEASQKAVELQDDFFSAWVSLGQSHTEQSNFKEAHAAFAKAAELNPQDEEIWISVGNSLYAQGKYDESITAYQKAIEIQPDVDSIWHNIGLAYQVQQKHRDAIEAFGKSVSINAANADSWYQQGRSYAEINQHTDAADCFSKTVEFTPDAHDAWYRKGLSLSKIGNHEEAITTLVKASELNPTDADIWYQMGLSHVAITKAEEAAGAFSQAISLAPNRPEVHYQLGLALESMARFEEATAAYRKSVDLSNEKVDAWFHLGVCHNFLSQHEEALTAFFKVLELAPDNTDVLLPIALAAHATGDFSQAITYYKKELEKRPDSEEAIYNLALALHATNNYHEALRVYHDVVKKWPHKDQAWYNMGLAYHAAGDFNQAIASYREATRINPDSPEIWYHMGLVFYATEHYGEAIQAFRKVISRAPDMYEAWFNIGNAYLVWHEYNDAVEAYEKAALLKPDDYTSWGYLGNAYFGAGMYDKALEASGKAFALKSDEPWIMSTLALSRLLTGDSAGAQPLFEALVEADQGGNEVARTVAEIEKALSKNPSLVGAQEILEKLTSASV
ncbi:MAG: tetratricopeptide repeat protein [Chitinispirillaceae bacterium]|nr:tetratricopeptide repeat protein [Chitinispirillaceae bacterium]